MTIKLITTDSIEIAELETVHDFRLRGYEQTVRCGRGSGDGVRDWISSSSREHVHRVVHALPTVAQALVNEPGESLSRVVVGESDCERVFRAC